jgi:hypothetical protein
MPKIETLLYLDDIAERGSDLFRAARMRDLEGIVGKWAHVHTRPTVAVREAHPDRRPVTMKRRPLQLRLVLER